MTIRNLIFCLPVLLLVFFGGCSNASDESAPSKILVLGDSLSSAYQMLPEEGWVSLLQDKLSACERSFQIINISRSGDTTRDGLQKLPVALKKHQPDLVLIELGGNDGLRGYPLLMIKRNLQRLIEQTKEQGIEVLLLGMKLPPNYGPGYADQFNQIYQDISDETDVKLVPFILEKVALDKSLMRSDGMHPIAKAQPLILDHVWPHLAQILKINPEAC